MDAHQRNADEKTEREPPFGVPVWVRCEGFRCLAVQDQHGRWRVFFNNTPLVGKVKVIDDQTKWKGAGE